MEPTLRDRRRAARAHLVSLLPPFSLPFTVSMQRRPEPFVAHHGRQATLLGTGLLVLLAVHVTLHLGVVGVRALHTFLERELGTSVPVWQIRLLGHLVYVNWGAMAAEYIVAVVMALRMAAGARRGELGAYLLPGRVPFPRRDPEKDGDDAQGSGTLPR